MTSHVECRRSFLWRLNAEKGWLLYAEIEIEIVYICGKVICVHLIIVDEIFSYSQSRANMDSLGGYILSCTRDAWAGEQPIHMDLSIQACPGWMHGTFGFHCTAGKIHPSSLNYSSSLSLSISVQGSKPPDFFAATSRPRRNACPRACETFTGNMQAAGLFPLDVVLYCVTYGRAPLFDQGLQTRQLNSALPLRRVDYTLSSPSAHSGVQQFT